MKLICPEISRPGKSLENRDQVWKNGRVFSFFQSDNIYIYIYIFHFGHIQFHPYVCSEKSFVPALFKVSFGNLFDSLESERRKKSGKALNFGSKNLYEPCREQQCITASLLYRNHHFNVLTEAQTIWYSVKIT